jgi:hypothetical protein
MLIAMLLSNPRALKSAPQAPPNCGYAQSGFLGTRRTAATEAMNETNGDLAAAWLPSERHQDDLFLAVPGITDHIPPIPLLSLDVHGQEIRQCRSYVQIVGSSVKRAGVCEHSLIHGK